MSYPARLEVEMNQRGLRSSGEFSDLTVQIGGQQLHLHRFPLFARSNYFRCLQRSGMSDTALLTLDHLPGGYDTMIAIADFCYGVSIDDKLTTKNIGHVTCAAIYLQMSGSGNLSEICQSKLKKLTSDVSNCLEILVNCAEIAEVAQAEGVSTFCVETAVEHWCKVNLETWNTFTTNWQSGKASLWLSQLKKLPVNWTTAIIDLMLTRSCYSSLCTYFVAGYIDFIMQCFFDVRKTESFHTASATSNSVYATSLSEPIVVAEPPNAIEVPFLSCSPEVSDRSTAAATSSSEKDLVDSKKQKAEDLALSSNETTTSDCYSRYHLPDAEESLLNSCFEAFVYYLPDDVLTLEIPTFTASWLSSALRFSSAFVTQSEERLTALCAKIYNQLTGKDVIELTSRVMANLNNRVHTNGYEYSNSVIELSDYYLNYHAERGTISAAQFTEVLQSTLWTCRSSFDSPFEAME